MDMRAANLVRWVVTAVGACSLMACAGIGEPGPADRGLQGSGGTLAVENRCQYGVTLVYFGEGGGDPGAIGDQLGTEEYIFPAEQRRWDVAPGTYRVRVHFDDAHREVTLRVEEGETSWCHIAGDFVVRKHEPDPEEDSTSSGDEGTTDGGGEQES
jgi:hypothetical protein